MACYFQRTQGKQICSNGCHIEQNTRVVPKVMSNFFFACELGTANEGECSGRWNQLLCYPSVSCDVNSLHHVTSITPNKMADDDMSFRQRAVIQFLVKDEIPAAEIHQRLQRAYGKVCAWVRAVFEDV